MACSTPSARRREGSTRGARRRRRGVRRRSRRCSRRWRGRPRRWRRSGRTGSWRCRCGTGCPTATAAWPASSNARPDAVAPGPLVAGVVDLVEDHHAVGGQRRAACPPMPVTGHLLVGGDRSRGRRGRGPAPAPSRGRAAAPIRWAASDHWILRWLVGATTTSRRWAPLLPRRAWPVRTPGRTSSCRRRGWRPPGSRGRRGRGSDRTRRAARGGG